MVFPGKVKFPVISNHLARYGHKGELSAVFSDIYYLDFSLGQRSTLIGEKGCFHVGVCLLSCFEQALFWSAHRRISAHFPRISDPSEISTNLLRKWVYI